MFIYSFFFLLLMPLLLFVLIMLFMMLISFMLIMLSMLVVLFILIMLSMLFVLFILLMLFILSFIADQFAPKLKRLNVIRPTIRNLHL